MGVPVGDQFEACTHQNVELEGGGGESNMHAFFEIKYAFLDLEEPKPL